MTTTTESIYAMHAGERGRFLEDHPYSGTLVEVTLNKGCGTVHLQAVNNPELRWIYLTRPCSVVIDA